jgi:hypothetical protein
MMKRVFVSLTFLLLASPSVYADSGQIIATQNVGDICSSSAITHRKTVVYVDLASIKKDEREWGLTILNKLELAPREWLTILGVNPNTFEITEVFDSCYPTLTKSEINATRSSRGWLDSLTKLDPDSQQRENIQAFESRLRNSLDKLVDAAVKFSPGKRRNLLGALAVDKNRFQDTRTFYRLVIYTDGSIVDPAFSGTTDKNQLIRQLTERYSASFSGANVYVYGVSGQNPEQPIETDAAIFTGYFLNSWGWLRSFAPSLPQQEHSIFQSVASMGGTFNGGGAEGAARLTIVKDDTAAASEAWLNFVVGANTLYVPFQGEYSCSGDKCTLSALATENIPVGSATPYFRKGDKLSLAGKIGGDLDGKIQPAAPEVFKTNQKDGTKDETQTDQKKAKQVEYILKLSAHL